MKKNHRGPLALLIFILVLSFTACSFLPVSPEPEILLGLGESEELPATDESETIGGNSSIEESRESNEEKEDVLSRLPEGAWPDPSRPAGEIIITDGVPQNSLISVTITNEAPTVNTEYLQRRIKNESSHYLYIIGEERLQRLVDEKWETVAPGAQIEPAYTITTLDGEIPSFRLEEYDNLLPGNYRIVTDVGYDFYIVSYFTLTE